MEHKFKIIKDYYGTGEKIYTKTSVTIKEGLTVLCGCNGSGKTTLITQIESDLHKNKIPCLYFNNQYDGGSEAIRHRGFYGDIDFVATAIQSSEGENINLNIAHFAEQMGSFVQKNHNAKEIFFLFDAVDSGLSIDNVIDLKEGLFSLVKSDCKNKGITVYIIASANEYELARNEQCLDVMNLKYVNISSYEDFSNVVLNSRKAKDKRYGLRD